MSKQDRAQTARALAKRLAIVAERLNHRADQLDDEASTEPMDKARLAQLWERILFLEAITDHACQP